MRVKKEFLDKVRDRRFVDTKNYHYIFDSDDGSILRKSIKELDTTSGWQCVAWWSMKENSWVKE